MLLDFRLFPFQSEVIQAIPLLPMAGPATQEFAAGAMTVGDACRSMVARGTC